jgi:hypothetical protein
LIEDLSAYLCEPCRLFVLLARNGKVGVILRRGPTRWWRVSRWDMRTDAIEGGQWFNGKIYPERCDLSPTGDLLVYFGGKFRARDIDRGYGGTYTAVSRPPYLTALALWPEGSTWGGGGVFLDDRTIVLHQLGGHHPNHPPGPLKVITFYASGNDAKPCFREGWKGVVTPPHTKRPFAWRKVVPSGLMLERTVVGEEYGRFYSKAGGAPHTLFSHDQEPLATFQADWADFDSEDRLVATSGGRLFIGELARKRGHLIWREIASLVAESFTPLVAPTWAQQWKPPAKYPRRNAK